MLVEFRFADAHLFAAQTGIEMMRAIPDLVLMSELSENEMYNVLTRRLKEKRIYTYIGDVLISELRSRVWVAPVTARQV